jgi:hypothetical protein
MGSSKVRTQRLGVVVVVGLVAALLSLVTVLAPPAGAEIDACGVVGFDVPDTQVGVFDFTDACAEHDRCYGVGGSWSDRYRCDWVFLSDMNASCSEMWPGWSKWRQRLRCNGVAYTYYAGVRLGGWAYFNWH